MKWLFAVLIALHAIIHVLGVSKGLGWMWLAAALGLLTFAGLWLSWPEAAWPVGLATLVGSQWLIIRAWEQAKWGTLLNALLLLLIVYVWAAYGPRSLRAQYQRDRAGVVNNAANIASKTADPKDLPPPVARYVRRSGALGQPIPSWFEVHFKGRIRGGSGEDWMPFSGTQINRVHPPARFFFMSARKAGLPVDVLHRFTEEGASMEVRLLSLIPLVSDAGEELTRAETVTIFNDLCFFSPSALARADMSSEARDDHHVQASYVIGKNRVTAELTFDEQGDLVDFYSNDRTQRLSDGSHRQLPWSTPMLEYGQFEGRRAFRRGTGVWHDPAGKYVYIELEVLELQVH